MPDSDTGPSRLPPEDCIVNYTPTGLVPTREMTPHVPLSVSQIAEDVLQASEKGITIAHLHARAGDGSPTLAPDTYARIIESIRASAPDLILCVSLSARVSTDLAQRLGPLDLDGSLKPDMASLVLGSLNIGGDCTLSSPRDIQTLAERMLDKGVKPELEAFDAGMLNYARYLFRKGVLTGRPYVNLILGNIASAQADLLHMGMLVNDLPRDAVFCLGGIGDCQPMVHAVAIGMAHGLRVGLEDTIWLDRERKTLATNMALLDRVHGMCGLCGRRVMPPAEARELLGLAPGHGDYGIAQSPR